VVNKRWNIHKFGGSSLADVDCFRRVADIILQADEARMGVVVSAMGGMTDALIELAILAERNDSGFEAALYAIGERYSGAASTLLQGQALIETLDAWSKDADDVVNVLKAIALVKSAPQRSRDIVAGFGEIWSARLLAAYLGQEAPERAGTWIDARDVLTVRETELGPTVLWEESQSKMDRALSADFEGIVVITGFIASDEDGLQTTLGRNGSDHSAAIFAALTNAGELSIWTDVDGVMSADPNRVPEAQVIDRLTYSEAMELAYFGAKVIHPQTLGPAVDNDIPVTIRNSRNSAHPGSRIEAASTPANNIKGITAIGGMALVNLEGAGMIGVPGTADRLFSSLKDAGVSVTLISQASSEHSICIAERSQTSWKVARSIASILRQHKALLPLSAMAWPARPESQHAFSVPWAAQVSTFVRSRRVRLRGIFQLLLIQTKQSKRSERCIPGSICRPKRYRLV